MCACVCVYMAQCKEISYQLVLVLNVVLVNLGAESEVIVAAKRY